METVQYTRYLVVRHDNKHFADSCDMTSDRYNSMYLTWYKTTVTYCIHQLNLANCVFLVIL